MSEMIKPETERDEPLTKKLGQGIVELTETGREFMTPFVTNLDKDVYAYTEKADPHTVATVFMRYSRNRNGGREIYADEFSGGEDKDLEVAYRVSQEFGDDSTQQLYSINIAVENVSQLVTKQIEHHRIGIAYLEKSTRYVPYDEKEEQFVPIYEDEVDYTEKDKFEEYKYITPSSIWGENRLIYRAVTDSLFDNYVKSVNRLITHVRETTPIPDGISNSVYLATTKAKALDAARVLLPASARTNLGFHASAQAVNQMIMRLGAAEISEASEIGSNILDEAKKLSPVFFERTSWPHRGGAQVQFYKDRRDSIKKSADRYLPPKNAEKIEGQLVVLSDYSPKDEFELLPYMMFEEASEGYSIKDISDLTSSLSIRQKQQIFRDYVGNPTNRRQKPGRAIERATYDWDHLSDFGAFRDLQRHRIVSDLKWQNLTTSHGFDIPELAREAGLERLYRRSIQLSEALCEHMKENDYHVEAQYAVLLGHKIRWTWQTNGRSNNHIFQLRSTPAGHPSYRQTVQTMHREVSKVHPNLARLSMPFMNMNDDPLLGRLDQEKAMEHKRKLRRD